MTAACHGPTPSPPAGGRPALCEGHASWGLVSPPVFLLFSVVTPGPCRTWVTCESPCSLAARQLPSCFRLLCRTPLILAGEALPGEQCPRWQEDKDLE